MIQSEKEIHFCLEKIVVKNEEQIKALEDIIMYKELSKRRESSWVMS